MTTDDSGLLNLPEEVLLHIFSYLPVSDLVLGVRPTCHYLHQLSLAPAVWNPLVVDLCPPLRGKSEKYFMGMLHQKCVTGVRRDDGCKTAGNGFLHGDDVDVVELRTVVTSVRERGDIWPRCSLTDHMCYPNLQRLTLVRCTLPRHDFLGRYNALLYLHIQVRYAYEHRNISFVAGCFGAFKGLRRLQTLRFLLGRGAQLDEAAVRSITDYVQTGPELTELQLELRLGSDVVKTILEHCSELRALGLSSSDLTSEAFRAVARKPSWSLRSLRLSKCLALDDRCLSVISTAFPNLQALDVALTKRTTRQGVGLLLKACSRLKRLKLIRYWTYADCFDDGVPPDSSDNDTDSDSDTDTVTKKIYTGHCLYEYFHNQDRRNFQGLYLSSFLFEYLRFRHWCRGQAGNVRTINVGGRSRRRELSFKSV